MNNKHGFAAEAGGSFLPDFCGSRAVISVLVITELVAILITLAAVDASSLLWERFLLMSLYLQWIGMVSAAGLCMVRRHLNNQPDRAVAGLCYLLLLGITAVISELAWRLAVYQELFLVLQMSHGEFLIRNIGVCAVVAALALRYFWIQSQWQQQALAAGDARFSALQARIRPHFLFNSLNSIAELARSRPTDAETAIEDLAALLRATLDEHDQPWPLADELQLCKAYARIERYRLGKRLEVDWDIPPALGKLSVPPLSLQPLLENAVRHGIEPSSGGGVVRISARQNSDTQCEIRISNPATGDSKPGSGEALRNIRQRLRFLYGPDDAELRTQTADGEFIVRMRLPMDKARA